MSQESPKLKRWYDKPPLFQAVNLLTALSDPLQSIISQALIRVALAELSAEGESSFAFRSLGSDKIMGLHKSKNKRRAYDQNELLHKFMNYLYILPHDRQIYLAEQILGLGQAIQKYLAVCGEFHASATTEALNALSTHYLEEGDAMLDAFLDSARSQFQAKLMDGDATEKAPATPGHSFRENTAPQQKEEEPEASASMPKEARSLDSAAAEDSSRRTLTG